VVPVLASLEENLEGRKGGRGVPGRVRKVSAYPSQCKLDSQWAKRWWWGSKNRRRSQGNKAIREVKEWRGTSRKKKRRRRRRRRRRYYILPLSLCNPLE